MRAPRKILLSVIILFSLITVNGYSQNSALYKKAVELRMQGKFHDALAIFKLLLGKDSNNTAYLDYTAVLSCKTLHDDTKPDNPSD